ncbi:helix-turn-helix domain-containing protein [Thermophilibacter mediterraneus]|uniref:helix-turn-helix domain-containing protein n=1 Tax=Thermophilibacter mediterraneus TaxID=1871031 RepID=UPI000930B446|nr:helix-turn-helix transcriptional regulator [Thermophilibacter mediterraneus]
MDTGKTCTYVRRHVGGRIEELRERSGVSQTQLAKMIPMNRTYYNDLVLGKANPTLDKLVKIADSLDVPLTELFFGLGDVPPHQLVEYDGTEGARATQARERS